MVVESNENSLFLNRNFVFLAPKCVTDRKRARSSLKRSSKRAAGRCSLMKLLSDRRREASIAKRRTTHKKMFVGRLLIA